MPPTADPLHLIVSATTYAAAITLSMMRDHFFSLDQGLSTSSWLIFLSKTRPEKPSLVPAVRPRCRLNFDRKNPSEKTKISMQSRILTRARLRISTLLIVSLDHRLTDRKISLFRKTIYDSRRFQGAPRRFKRRYRCASLSRRCELHAFLAIVRDSSDKMCHFFHISDLSHL